MQRRELPTRIVSGLNSSTQPIFDRRFVSLDAPSGTDAVKIADGSDPIYGVAMNEIAPDTSGDVQVGGLARAIAAVDIARGDRVGSNANGLGVPVTGGEFIGVCMSGALAGDTFSLELQPFKQAPGGGSGNITLEVPGGSSHDFWLSTRNGITDLIAQADTDFDVKTSFDAPPPSDTAHGFIVGDVDLLTTGRFVRWDVYNTGGGATLFAADDLGSVFLNTALPAGHTWLRLQRVGSTFTVYSSNDGTSWTNHTSFGAGMTVAQLGVWAGNFNTNPAHTVTFTPIEPA